ncbi:hypothetical protein BSKO_13726 [Bryopsis sp. KO-2023]|nr:hypothetical protein BSKO_13726 [Bryopsis sp. KO-2023]
MDVIPPTCCSRHIEVGGYDPPEVSKKKGGVSEIVVFLVGDDRNGLVGRKEVFVKHCLRVDGCREWIDFESGQHGSGKPTFINLPDLSRKGVEPCLQFVETGSCRFEPSILWEVFDAAVFLNLGPVARVCVPRVVADLRPETAWRGLENGMLMGSRDLTDEALKVTIGKLRKVLEKTDMSASWVTSGALLKVLKEKQLPIRETTLARKVLTWAENTKEDAEAVWKVMEHVSWMVILKVDEELFRRALAVEAFSAGLKKRGLEDPMSLVATDLPNCPRLGTYGAFNLDPVNCSPFDDVGPPIEHGSLRWMDFEDAPCPDVLHVDRTGFLQIPDPEGKLNATKEFSVRAWVRHDFWGAPYQGPIACKSGPGSGWELRISNTAAQFFVTLRNSDGEQWHESVGVNLKRNPDHWYSLLGTFDGSEARIYVDGSMEEMSRLSDWNTDGDRIIDADCEVRHCDSDLCVGAHADAGWRNERDFEGDICGLTIVTNQVLAPDDP